MQDAHTEVPDITESNEQLPEGLQESCDKIRETLCGYKKVEVAARHKVGMIVKGIMDEPVWP